MANLGGDFMGLGDVLHWLWPRPTYAVTLVVRFGKFRLIIRALKGKSYLIAGP